MKELPIATGDTIQLDDDIYEVFHYCRFNRTLGGRVIVFSAVEGRAGVTPHHLDFIIAKPGLGQAIGYVDGDMLNLQRSNLRLQSSLGMQETDFPANVIPFRPRKPKGFLSRFI